MKALKIIGIILLVILALFFIVAAFLPSKIHVEESIVINKPASLIFKQVNNFQNYQAWSPWLELDPEITNTYEGPRLGVGAKSIWTSKKSGDGNMTIIESLPYKKVTTALDFGQKGTATSDFLLAEEAGGTKVTWTMDIPSLSYPVERYFGLMMPGMMKTVFIKGLENLKKVTEAMPDPPVLQLTQIPEKPVVSVIDSCKWADIGMKMGQMFGEIMTFQKIARFEFAGPPLSIYHKWDEVKQFTVFENCMPVDREVVGKGRIRFKTLPATLAVMGTHFGAYEKTLYLYNAMDEFILEFGLEQNGGPIEEYITDPVTEPDTAKWQTNIYFPVK